MAGSRHAWVSPRLEKAGVLRIAGMRLSARLPANLTALPACRYPSTPRGPVNRTADAATVSPSIAAVPRVALRRAPDLACRAVRAQTALDDPADRPHARIRARRRT